jgi:hypothetical protein
MRCGRRAASPCSRASPRRWAEALPALAAASPSGRTGTCGGGFGEGERIGSVQARTLDARLHMVERAFEVRLTIPDNEAYTALTTLRRLEVACEEVVRADVHVFGVDEGVDTEELTRALKTAATIYNPNKHRLRPLPTPRPSPGEVWITSDGAVPRERDRIVVGGVELKGVRTAWRATSWRLLDGGGNPVAAEVLDRAVETLLCNPAFQRAIKA